MICRSLAESDGLFWQPAEFENVANPDFEIFKPLQNLRHFFADCSYNRVRSKPSFFRLKAFKIYYVVTSAARRAARKSVCLSA